MNLTNLCTTLAVAFLAVSAVVAQAPTPTPISAPTGGNIVLGSGISDSTQFSDGQVNQVFRWARFARRDSVPPADTGWHYHPNYSYYVVTKGTLTVEDGCGGTTKYTQGQAFEKTEGRIHRGYVVDDPNTPENEGAEDEYEFQFYLRRVGAPFAVDVFPRMTHGEMRNPCGPVRNVDECKDNGWMRFNHPNVFANQGECIGFANNRRRLTTLVPDDY